MKPVTFRPLAVAVLGAGLLLTVLTGPAAFAAEDPSTPSAQCAAALPKPGRLMFKTTAPHVKADSDIAMLMRAFITPLVMDGKVTRKEAMDNANAVGACLMLRKQETPA